MKPFLVLFLMISTSLSAQDSDRIPERTPNGSIGKFQIGFNVSPVGFFEADRAPLHDESEYDYEPVFTVNSYLSFGITSLYKLNEFIKIGPGISYTKMQMERQFYVNPPESQSLSLLEIPLILKFEFLRYFYASQGLLLHFELTDHGFVSSQNGSGYFISLGFNYNFKSGLSVFGGPVYKGYSLKPQKNWEIMILGAEINFGVLIRL